MLRNLHLYRLRAGRQPETWRTTNGCWGRRRWLAQQDLQKCPKRTSPLFGGVKKIATCANCAHASSGRVSWNASQNGPQTRGEHASCWGAGGGGVSAIQFPAVQNGCGNTIYLIRRRAGGEGPETLAGVDSYLATQFKRLIRRRWGDKLIGKPQAQVPQNKQRPERCVDRWTDNLIWKPQFQVPQKKQRPVPNVSRQRTINLSPAATGGSLHQGNLLELPNSYALGVAVPAPARCGPSVAPVRCLVKGLSASVAFVVTILKPRDRTAPKHADPPGAHVLERKKTKTPPSKT